MTRRYCTMGPNPNSNTFVSTTPGLSSRGVIQKIVSLHSKCMCGCGSRSFCLRPRELRTNRSLSSSRPQHIASPSSPNVPRLSPSNSFLSPSSTTIQRSPSPFSSTKRSVHTNILPVIGAIGPYLRRNRTRLTNLTFYSVFFFSIVTVSMSFRNEGEPLLPCPARRTAAGSGDRLGVGMEEEVPWTRNIAGSEGKESESTLGSGKRKKKRTWLQEEV